MKDTAVREVNPLENNAFFKSIKRDSLSNPAIPYFCDPNSILSPSNFICKLHFPLFLSLSNKKLHFCPFRRRGAFADRSGMRFFLLLPRPFGAPPSEREARGITKLRQLLLPPLRGTSLKEGGKGNCETPAITPSAPTGHLPQRGRQGELRNSGNYSLSLAASVNLRTASQLPREGAYDEDATTLPSCLRQDTSPYTGEAKIRNFSKFRKALSRPEEEAIVRMQQPLRLAFGKTPPLTQGEAKIRNFSKFRKH